jgi:hypothetical protein
MEPTAEEATQPNTAMTAINILLPTTFHHAILPSPTKNDPTGKNG